MAAVSPAEFRTPAEYIEARQRQHPPKYQRTSNAWRALFAVALKLSDPSIQRKAERGVIASGEVGELTPVARVTAVGRGHAIEMHSGLMRLIYSAARAIFATDSGRFQGGGQTGSLSQADATIHIADLFKSYDQRGVATVQRFPATESQLGWANAITVHAETFLLMHELAHIFNEHSSWISGLVARNSNTYNREVQADSTAAEWLIDYILHSERQGPQRQMIYAGAEFGFRIRMAMETVGMQFEQTHPKAGDRVASLRARFRNAVGSRKFYATANTSIAYDQMWRAIERNLTPGASTTSTKSDDIDKTLDDVLATTRTAVTELLDGSDVREVIRIEQVAGQPGSMRALFLPTDPLKVALLQSVRNEYLGSVDQAILEAARTHVSDLYEPGTLQFSVALGILNSARHRGDNNEPAEDQRGEPASAVPLSGLGIRIEGDSFVVRTE